MNRILVAIIVVMLTSCLVPEEKYNSLSIELDQKNNDNDKLTKELDSLQLDYNKLETEKNEIANKLEEYENIHRNYAIPLVKIILEKGHNTKYVQDCGKIIYYSATILDSIKKIPLTQELFSGVVECLSNPATIISDEKFAEIQVTEYFGINFIIDFFLKSNNEVTVIALNDKGEILSTIIIPIEPIKEDKDKVTYLMDEKETHNEIIDQKKINNIWNNLVYLYIESQNRNSPMGELIDPTFENSSLTSKILTTDEMKMFKYSDNEILEILKTEINSDTNFNNYLMLNEMVNRISIYGM